jgi:GNAT superfamily N-acetyltransferase
MSLYSEYVQERLGDCILETELGFATYRFPDPNTVYIVDLYVIPEARKQGVARDIADSIMKIAMARGCTKMIGSVVPSARGSTESLKTLLAYGMILDSGVNDFIILRKDLA